MATVAAPLSTRIKVALSGVGYFFTHISSIALFILFSLVGFTLINALLDLELLWTLLTLDAPLYLRLDAITDVLFSLDGLPFPNKVTAVIMALLFGYVIASSIFVALRQQAKSGKSGSIGILFGIIGSGCAACGTSLLAPLLTTIGITTTSAALSFALYLNIFGIFILIYSSYRISIVLASNK